MDQSNVDQTQFMKQVRERAQVLSKNARQKPDEVAEKVSKYDEEDEEMKDYLHVIRSTEKGDSGSSETPMNVQKDELDLDFASQLASPSHLDFSKERFKAGLAQRRMQKRRRPQSWAWAASTDNEAVKIKEVQGASDLSLNVSIEMDEDREPDETPKKTRPANRFSSPLFSDKLMSDLGSVLNKKKSPIGKPGPSIPSKSPRNVGESTENSPSDALKSKSPVSSPRSSSPMTPQSESPIFQKNAQQGTKVNRSSSPNLVLVTERDVFGLKQSPIFHRRLQEGTSQELNPKSDYLRENIGKIEKGATSKERTQDQDTGNAIKIPFDSADISKNQQRPPPPKPKIKPKMGQSSAMLLKNATEQNKSDIAKEEEKRVGKAIPNWLEELQKKKVKSSNAGQSKGPVIKQNQISSKAAAKMPSTKEPSTMVEPSTDALPAWMKSEFLKVKQGTDTMESEQPNLKSNIGQERGIDHLLKKSKESEPSKPSWLDELDKRKKNQALFSDKIVKESDQFDYRSYEEIKQKNKESTGDEDDEADGVMKSVSDIKAKLNKNIIENEKENVMKKPTLLKHINDDVSVKERNDALGSKEIDLTLVTPESSGKREDLVGESERNLSRLEYRDGDSESRDGLLEKRGILNRVDSNPNVKPHNSYNDIKDSSSSESNVLYEMVNKGGYVDVDGSKDEITSKNHENKKELMMEKPTNRGISFESSYLWSNVNKSGGLEYTQQDDTRSSQNSGEKAMAVNSIDEEFVQSHNKEKKINISSELNSKSSQTGDSIRMDIEKLDVFKEEIPLKSETIQSNGSKEVKKDVVLEFQQREENDGKKEGSYSSGVTKGGLMEPEKKEYKLSMEPKSTEKLEAAGAPEGIEKSSTLSSNGAVDSSSIHTYPEPHLDNEMSKMEEKEDERKMFPKLLRRKLVRINSFEQGALSKPEYNEVGQNNASNEVAKNEEPHIKQESTANEEKAAAVKNQVLFDDQKSEDNEIAIAGASDTRNKIDSDNVETGKETKIDNINTDLTFKTGIGANYDRDKSSTENLNTKKDASFQDLRKDASLINTEKTCQGKDAVLDTKKDSLEYEKGGHRMAFSDMRKENSPVKKDMQREMPKISKAVSDVEKQTSVEEKELSDKITTNAGMNKDNGKGGGLDFKKDISMLEKEGKPPPSKRKPPAPKPKPKPKPRVPLKNVAEVKHSEQKDDIAKDTFVKVDSKDSKVEPKQTKVTQIENLKNIEKSKNIKELESERVAEPNEKPSEQIPKAVEKETENKVEMRKKDENRTRQTRPISMFESISAVDNNLPVRDRKFSGVSSGTKFAVELERKQKSCWFRGALDTSDIKSFQSYDGDDDIPAWKRQLLAKLKSNEKPSAKKLDRGKVMDHEKRDGVSHFRGRTVTSPDGLSKPKMVPQVTPKNSPIIEEAFGDSNSSQNEEQEREVPEFLLEFASKRLKAHKGGGLPKMHNEKEEPMK